MYAPTTNSIQDLNRMESCFRYLLVCTHVSGSAQARTHRIIGRGGIRNTSGLEVRMLIGCVCMYE